MTFNKNIVLGFLISEFSENIECEITDSILDMDGYELDHIFGQLTDYATLDDIVEIEVEQFETCTRGQEIEIDGILKLVIFLEGYAHWEGEDVLVGCAETVMRFRFHFTKKDKMYNEFEIHRLRN